MSRELKILYMNSFSRSGETLMQRTLNAHKNIASLVQLEKQDKESKLQYDVFKKIKEERPASIILSDSEFSELDLADETTILLVKNAIFLNDKKRYSFMLLRNPYSVYASYQKLANHLNDTRQQMRNWANHIDRKLLRLVNNGDFLDALMSLYVKKTFIEYATSSAVIKYEAFISQPEETLKQLLETLSIDWDESVLYAHEHYDVGEKGHGGIKLWQDIQGEKANQLPTTLSEMEYDRIYGYCSTLLETTGYDIENGKLLFSS